MHFLTTALSVAVALMWVTSGGATEEESDEHLIYGITEQLPTLPGHGTRELTARMIGLFNGADQARLEHLARHPNWNIGMYARWEMRETLFQLTFDSENEYYPVRFLESKGIDVPVAWARVFAGQFLPNRVLRRQASDYYEKRVESIRRVSFVNDDPRTYVRCTHCDIPAGTTVTESDTQLTVKQGDMTVVLHKPLTGNFYAPLAALYGESLFLPLLTKDATYVLYVRTTDALPFVLVCFDSSSGERKWETIGWSALPVAVAVIPWNLLPPHCDAKPSSPLVGTELIPGKDKVNEGRGWGQSGPHSGACSLYLVANDRSVTVFGADGGIIFVETFDVRTGRNLLRFTPYFYSDKSEQSWESIQRRG